MCEKSEKRTNYVRTHLMYKNVTKEVLFKVFKYLIKSEDIEGFLSSPEQHNNLSILQKKKKIAINQNEHTLLSQTDIDLKKFDISLLLNLILNLCKDKIQQEDESLGVDLLQLRDIRNEFIGHRADTDLPETEYETTWANIQSILLRVVELVDSKSRDVFEQSIKEYERLQVDTVHRLSDELIQEKVEELKSRSKEFQVNYKATLSQFVRFIKLLFYGGRIALCGILKNKLGEQDLSDVLERKKETLTRNIGEKFSSCLYPQGSCSDYKIWDVSLLASVLLIAFKDDLGRDENNIENNIKCIQSIREKNAILVSQFLDKDDFLTMWIDLVNCLNKLSMNISEGERRQVDNLIERYKKKDEGGCDAEECIKQLREFGVDDDVYNAIVVELSDMLEQLSKEGIKLKQEHVIKLKLLTRCENEETKKKAKYLLRQYLKASIQQSDEPAGHLRNEIDNLVASMSAVPDVTPV